MCKIHLYITQIFYNKKLVLVKKNKRKTFPGLIVGQLTKNINMKVIFHVLEIRILMESLQ